MSRCKLFTKSIFIIYGIILIAVLFYNWHIPIIEGLSDKMENNVLMGVGADYKLYAYTGSGWNAIKTPTELVAGNLLDMTLGPDGTLYAVGTDYKLYKDGSGTWVKLPQPTSTQAISVTTINDKLILVAQDHRMYNYNIETATVNPMPGKTGPVLSVVVLEGTQYGVGEDYKLYRWVNNKWGVFDGDANITNVSVYNNNLVGVGRDKKLYQFDAQAKSSSASKSPPSWPMKGVCDKPGATCKYCQKDVVKKNLGVQYTTAKMFPTICPSRGNEKDCKAAGGQWGDSTHSCKYCQKDVVKKNLGAQYTTAKMFPTICPSRGNEKDCTAAGGQWVDSILSCNGDTSCKNIAGSDGCKTKCLKNSDCKYYSYGSSSSSSSKTGKCMLFSSCNNPKGAISGYTNYKTYSIEGATQNLTPGSKWKPLAQQKGRSLLSVYTLRHDQYTDIGFT